MQTTGWGGAGMEEDAALATIKAALDNGINCEWILPGFQASAQNAFWFGIEYSGHRFCMEAGSILSDANMLVCTAQSWTQQKRMLSTDFQTRQR